MKATLNQMYYAVTADSSCEEPQANEKEKVQDLMKCTFSRGQKGAWEWILFLMLCLRVVSTILSIMWRNTTNVITQVKTIFVNRNQNLMVSNDANPTDGVVRPNTRPKTKDPNVAIEIDDNIRGSRGELNNNRW